MGTNYYVRFNRCELCGRYQEFHIGKSSAGWKFMFHFIEGKAESFEDWKRLLAREDAVIVDEYGKEWGKEDFWSLVEAKQKESSQLLAHETFRDIGGYDFMQGEFQ